MAAITPERIKNVLSSFLVKSETSPSVIEIFSKPRCIQEPEDLSSQDVTASKSGTVVALRSHKSYLKRLDTFSGMTWFGKPSELSPLVCARYGWENIDVDMLQCAGCKTFLSGKLPMRCDIEAYNVSLEKLKKNIESSHDRLCVFGTLPCPESFCRIQVEDVASLSASFNKRVCSLAVTQDQLPNLNLTQLENFGYDEGQAGAYCKRHLMPDNDVSPQAVTLAVMGWTCSPSNKDVLICSMCRRKIGIWNFVSSPETTVEKQSASEEEEDSGEPRAKRKRISTSKKKEALNPVTEHCHWCPWIQLHQPTKTSTSTSSVSQSLCSTPTKGGCNISGPGTVSTSIVPVYIEALKSIAPGLIDNNTGLATDMKKSPMTEGLRCFRRTINMWSSPKSKSPNSSILSECSSPSNVATPHS